MGLKVKPPYVLAGGLGYFGIAFLLNEPYNMILWFIAGMLCGLSAAQIIIEILMKEKDD